MVGFVVVVVVVEVDWVEFVVVGVVVVAFVLDDVPFTVAEPDSIENAYCGKIRSAKKEKNIRIFALMRTSLQSSANKQFRHIVR